MDLSQGWNLIWKDLLSVSFFVQCSFINKSIQSELQLIASCAWKDLSSM